MNAPDRKTLWALRDGSIRAFEDVLTAYERAIFTYLVRITGNRDDAADLTQETFLKVYKNRQHVDPDRNFKSWLYTIATHTAYDWLRKKRGVQSVSMEEEGTETNPDIPAYNLSEENLDVAAAMAAIRPAYRTALLMFYAEGLSYEEMSSILDLPVNTVKTHLHRGKEELRKELHGYTG